MSEMVVVFNKPVMLPNIPQYIRDSLTSNHLSGMGPMTKRCESLLSEINHCSNLITSSATHALEMMALLLNIKAGDEVIIPSYTFVSTANAFALRGAKIVFAENDDFGNISIPDVEQLINRRTKAVVAVHYAGNSADMNQLSAITKKFGVALLEDAAQAIGSTFRGRQLGTMGDLGCYSFHETKNVHCGEGGALILGKDEFLERAEIIREKGTNRRKFSQGLVDKYSWVDIGSSYVLSDLNCAILIPQLEKLSEINDKRKSIWGKYKSALTSDLNRIGAEILGRPDHNDNPNHHLFAILFDKPLERTDFIKFMFEKGVLAPFHYVSLHTSSYARSLSSEQPRALKNCDRFSHCLVRLPLFYNMTDDQSSYVIEKTREWLRSKI
ncbi:MAG: dTDP-4-amino-4,6-dideoxygalactose transaminase [Bdellovibrionaceae bacterium]|nr:dTDP-4-amino-4,6-dideoxygalactose transaminase [Pseudobdellovibrionaceae bacterium]